MHSIHHRALAAALACIPPCAMAETRSASLPDRLLDELRRSTGSTGMAAAIVKDGKLAWHGESGYADLEAKLPVTPRTEFRLGSVSKFVTVAMLARLVDQGKIDLNQPVHAYLPDYPPKEHAFTLQQLLVHTSGMPHYQMPQDAMLDARQAPYRSAGEALSVFRERPLLHAPGSKYLYSTFGYNLLSAVMEKVTGKDFPRQLEETVALARTPSLQVERNEAPGKHWSRLYDGAGGELPRQNITHKWAGGGLLANASDVALFGAKTLDPAFISPHTFTRFTTPARLTNGDVIRVDRSTMGTGWRLSTDPDARRYVHHAGVIQGGRSNVNVYPGERAAAALLANMQAGIAAELTTDALYDAHARAHQHGKCLEGQRRYRASYRDEPIAGTVQFLAEGGFCKAVFSADNPLGRWMAPGRLGTQFVAYSAAGTGPAYYVTPVGIFAGKADASLHTIQLLGQPLALTLE